MPHVPSTPSGYGAGMVRRLMILPAALLPSALLLTTMGCGTTPLQPETPPSDSGAAALRVRMAGRDGISRTYATKVHYVKLKPGEDPTQGRTFVTADISRGHVVYALGLEPGRYAPVAVEEKRDGRVYTTYFPSETIVAATFVVDAGRLVSLGLLDLKLAPLGRRTDKAQAYYARRLGPDWTKANLAQRLFHRNRFHDGFDPTWRTDDKSVRERITRDLPNWPVDPPRGPAAER